jgi:anti-sigma factor RsiW
MKLNRNNYEEYFLMYVDNELTAAERSAVEEFIALNPDLKPELEILQQTVLQPEPLSFDKSSLFAIASQGINKENHEEYFIEYVNNELSAADKNATETFVLQHPELQESFTAFKATVLQSELVEFKNKETLYRKEDTRVIAFSFQRFAVAAAVLGIIATGIWFYPSKEDQSPIAVTKSNTKQSSTVAPATSVTSSSTNTVVAEEKKTTEVASKFISDKILNTPVDANNILATTTVTKNFDPRSTDITTEEKPETKTVYTQGVVTENTDRTNTIAGTISNEKGGLTKIIEDQTPAVETNVAYTTLETEETDNNVYVGALSINKDKLKGVFRKATRLFSSKTKNENEDGKLQIANLEIETRKNK